MQMSLNLLTGDPREVAKRFEAYSRQKDYEKLSEIAAGLANALNRIAELEVRIENLGRIVERIEKTA